MPLNRPEDILYFTQQNPFDRFPNGRPRVPDELLQRVALVTIEEAWSVLCRHGYTHQYEGGWWNVHPERVLVGRAVTAAFVPTRPDLHQAIEAWGEQHGGVGGQNSWVIDTLVEDDVIVVDLFSKVENGTFAGDNLGTAIARRTKTGMVIDGGIRDFARLQAIPGIAIFARGTDPTPIAEVALVGLNCPIRIGHATVLPGDVVLGTCTGVIFIPPHLVQEVVEESERVRLQDRWGQMRLREGKYLPGQVDGKWTDEMRTDFEEWRKTQQT
ncbi:MAG: RraA family protein [Armatimonadetes bacterium]|nr:RraA family protein [Armatimonadota bacterium]